MSGKLKDLLALPDLPQSASNGQSAEFGRAFRDRISGLNQELQVVASQASRTTYQALEIQRDKLLQAYQRTSAKINPADPFRSEHDMQRVIDAVASTKQKAASTATDALAKRDRWLALEPEFDDALLKVSELEDAGEQKASALRKLSDVIRARASERNYEESTITFEQMRTKLDTIYEQYVKIASREGLTVLVRDGQAKEALEGAQVIGGDRVTSIQFEMPAHAENAAQRDGKSRDVDSGSVVSKNGGAERLSTRERDQLWQEVEQIERFMDEATAQVFA